MAICYSMRNSGTCRPQTIIAATAGSKNLGNKFPNRAPDYRGPFFRCYLERIHKKCTRFLGSNARPTETLDNSCCAAVAFVPGVCMFGDTLNWLMTEEELTSFLQLWGWLFAVAFTLRLLQRIRNWSRRRRATRRLGKEQRKSRRFT